MSNLERNEALARRLNKYVYLISGIILLLVFLMDRYKVDLGINFRFLPPVHAILNTFVAICLIMALYYIKRKNVDFHRKFIYAAFFFSFLFLLCYLLYHFTTPETKYCYSGTWKVVYLCLLISHICLAGISLPFILLTFVRGYTGLIFEHRRMARWVYPIWLYVAITGPLVYLMLSSCYKQ